MKNLFFYIFIIFILIFCTTINRRKDISENYQNNNKYLWLCKAVSKLTKSKYKYYKPQKYWKDDIKRYIKQLGGFRKNMTTFAKKKYLNDHNIVPVLQLYQPFQEIPSDKNNKNYIAGEQVDSETKKNFNQIKNQKVTINNFPLMEHDVYCKLINKNDLKENIRNKIPFAFREIKTDPIKLRDNKDKWGNSKQWNKKYPFTKIGNNDRNIYKNLKDLELLTFTKHMLNTPSDTIKRRFDKINTDDENVTLYLIDENIIQNSDTTKKLNWNNDKYKNNQWLHNNVISKLIPKSKSLNYTIRKHLNPIHTYMTTPYINPTETAKPIRNPFIN